MALNIKDPATEALVAELARQLHTSKTGAVRHALQAQLDVLAARREVRDRSRADELITFLRTEIWPITAAAEPLTKHDREQILGYTADGV